MLKLACCAAVAGLLSSGTAAGHVALTGGRTSSTPIVAAAMTQSQPQTQVRSDGDVAIERHVDRTLVRTLHGRELVRRRTAGLTPIPELPGGGIQLYPGRRLVALYGHPNAPVLGVLGEQPLQASIRRAKRLASSYAKASTTPAIPTFELITTVASKSAGSDGNYSNEKKIRDIRPWIVAAGKAGVYVALDLQPGRSDFLTQAKRYESLLKFPHVGLALDPEWRLKPGQVHLRQIGSVSASEINRVVKWLADLTASNRLPQKLLLIHQFRLSMITNREQLDTSRKEVAVVIQMDGFGRPTTKLATWRALRADAPRGVRFGWKNFYDEDTPTFSPRRTVSLRPSPVFVSYQ